MSGQSTLKKKASSTAKKDISIVNFHNQVINGDCVEVLKQLPSDSIDLVIADPPYWKVVGEKWDYQWRLESDYIEWCRTWFEEVHRVLKKGGSFYLFGYFRMLALQLTDLVDKNGFELRQQIIIDKGMRSMGGRATKNYKMFPNVTESVIFLVKNSKPFIRDFLKEQQKKKGYTSKEINELLGVKSNGGGMWSIYTGKNICEQVPTRELWTKLQNIFDFDLPYEEIAITFNAQMGYTDVWTDINFYKEKRYHTTQKPIKLIERLILASSNEDMLVLDPFLGAGSTAIAAKNLNRKFIGIDMDKEYCQIAKERLEHTQDSPL